jgi:hypothetical protein
VRGGVSAGRGRREGGRSGNDTGAAAAAAAVARGTARPWRRQGRLGPRDRAGVRRDDAVARDYDRGTSGMWRVTAARARAKGSWGRGREAASPLSAASPTDVDEAAVVLHALARAARRLLLLLLRRHLGGLAAHLAGTGERAVNLACCVVFWGGGGRSQSIDPPPWPCSRSCSRGATSRWDLGSRQQPVDRQVRRRARQGRGGRGGGPLSSVSRRGGCSSAE